MNAFHIMGLPVVWAIDDDDLEQRYEQCQMSVHPDKQSVKGRDIIDDIQVTVACAGRNKYDSLSVWRPDGGFINFGVGSQAGMNLSTNGV